MKRHLSEEQFIDCILRGSESEGMVHLQACPECGAGLERFRKTLGSFRDAIRETTDARIAQGTTIPARAQRLHIPVWAWETAAIVLATVFMTLYLHKQEVPPPAVDPNAVVSDPDALMRAVNFELSSAVPGSLAPVMQLLPDSEPQPDSGGHQ